jgi:hypothetical protein
MPSEHRPHQGKDAGGLDEQPGRLVGQVLPVQLGQPPFEIVVDQRDRQVGGALDHANAQRGQRGAELLCALDIDRLNAHPEFAELAFHCLRRQAEARPIRARGACGRARSDGDIAAIDQPLQGFVDLVGRKILLQGANELPDALAGSHRGCERAVELAVEKELSVLGIEAYDIGRQHIDGEIRREPHNVMAVTLR